MRRHITFVVLLILSIAALAYAGSVTLTWDSPTTNTDSTPLTDLAYFNIYYGASSGLYSGIATSVLATNPSPTIPEAYSTTFTMPSGTWYFVVTAVSSTGQESDWSNEKSVFVGGNSANLVGASAAAISGSLFASGQRNVSTVFSGIPATARAGSITVSGNPINGTITLPGMSTTAAAGTMLISGQRNMTAPLTSPATIATAGSLLVSGQRNENISLTGASAIATRGYLGVSDGRVMPTSDELSGHEILDEFD